MTNNTFISREELEKIAEHLTLTNHAKERIIERLGNKTEDEIKNLITHSALSWHNTDNTIGIQIDKNNFFVVSEEKADNRYILITVKEKSCNEKAIAHKVYLAFIGKQQKGETRTYRETTPNKKRKLKGKQNGI